MVTSSLAVALMSYRFFPLGIDASFAQLGAAVLDPRLPFVVHVVSAPVALATGAWQFFSGIRKKRPRFHRWSGRIYGLAILLGGLSGLIMALYSPERPLAAVGFGLLAILWLWFTAKAIWYARQRNFATHRAMMIRSFALTFAAVTLRLQLPFLLSDGSNYMEISHIVAWTCWVPNLLAVELYLRFWQKASIAKQP